MAAISNLVSFFSKAYKLIPVNNIPLDIFLENIRSGEYQDIVNKIRVIEDKKQRDELKKKIAPYITVAGTFTERYDNKLEQHSTFIGIDLDDLEDINETKSIICTDRFVVAAFVSISGRGLCLIFRIDPKKHTEAFQGISEYLLNNYQLVCDPTSVNVSRARFVSYDPHIYINERADKFTQYPKPKEKAPKRVDRVLYSKDDFGDILKQIVEGQINITQDSYHIWLRIAFALVDKFKEAGREYFHTISQFSSKYERSVADKQYDVCLKHETGGKEVHISTLYYYAKQCGVNLYSERTRLIAYSASQGKKGGLSPEKVSENLKKFEGIEEAEEIIKQVWEGVEIDEDTVIDQLEIWLRQNYDLKRNEITRYIENKGEILKQKDLNTIFIKAKKIFETITYELIDRLINSDFVPTYNPFKVFFKTHERQSSEVNYNPFSTTETDTEANDDPYPLTRELFSTINTKDSNFLLHFGRKWLVGAISAIHGEHSPLMLVLSGEVQNTGKTEWFRRLPPKDLLPYYAESKLDAGKDDEILMTQKLWIMDDEMGGKSKKEVKRLKELTSKQTFSLREPYGRNNVDLNRLAVLCGTTNDNEILSDPTGNRRIIPIHVYSIDNTKYNSINKTDLWVEVYEMWKTGFKWKLDRTDIEYLSTDNPFFEVSEAETELIQQFYEPGTTALTATEIKIEIEKHTNQRLSLDRISKQLKRLGFEQKHIRQGKGTKRVYLVCSLRGSLNAPGHAADDIPF